MRICELKNGEYIGLKTYEIISLPEVDPTSDGYLQAVEKNANLFQKTITEYQKICGSFNCCAEIIWATEHIKGQTIRSRIRLFFAIRCRAQNAFQTEAEMKLVDQQFVTNLKFGQYEFQECSEDCVESVLSPVMGKPIYAIVKSEKCTGISVSPYPYYFWDVLPAHNTDNFMNLQAALSGMEDCCVSFQLFPTSLSQSEQYWLQEEAASLAKLSNGTNIGPKMIQDQTALVPQQVMAYYSEHSSSPLFYYNILVNGKWEYASLIHARIVSLLGAGKESIATSDCTAIDLSSENINLAKCLLVYPWNINNLLQYKYRNNKIQKTIPAAQVFKRLPYLVTAEEANSFFRLPMYEKGMAALKRNVMHQNVEQLGSKVTDSSGIEMGSFPENIDTKIYFPAELFTQHGVVVGMPGTGKTTASIALLLQFAHKGIPFLAIEPTKTEYRAMIDVIPDLQIFTPGNNSVSPFVINPFLPPTNIELEKYIPSLVTAFNAAFDMTTPLDILFLSAVNDCYAEHGWKNYSKRGDPDVTVFGLREFICSFKKVIRESDYGKEVKGNLESAGVFRLMNLIEQNGNIYDTIHSVPIEDLLQHPTVLELNAIENREQKALIMALILVIICIYTKNNVAGDGKIKNILLMDEAHVLLNNGTDEDITSKMVMNLIAEIRSYGTGIIIADQRPSQIGRGIIGNTGVKIVFRLVENLEKEIVADSMNMDESAKKQIGTLEVGQAYVYSHLLKAPYKIVTKDIRYKEGIRLNVGNQEICEKMHYWDTRSELLCPYQECEWSQICGGKCDYHLRSDADFYISKLIILHGKEITNVEILKKYIVGMPTVLGKIVASLNSLEQKRVINCCRIKLNKKMQIDKNINISSSLMKRILGQE